MKDFDFRDDDPQDDPVDAGSSKALLEAIKKVAAAGRGGDELLAYLSPESVQALKSMGGAGTINPVTSLPEFKGGNQPQGVAPKPATPAPAPVTPTITPSEQLRRLIAEQAPLNAWRESIGAFDQQGRLSGLNPVVPSSAMAGRSIDVRPVSAPVFGSGAAVPGSGGMVSRGINIRPVDLPTLSQLSQLYSQPSFQGGISVPSFAPYVPGQMRRPEMAVMGFAKGGEADAEEMDALLDEEEEEPVNTDPVGSAQGMMSELMASETPRTQTIARVRRQPIGDGAARPKGMTAEYESLTTAKAPEPKGAKSAQAELRALVRDYTLKRTAAENAARGLMRDTLGAPTLEKPTLRQGPLMQNRFAEGGEAKKAQGEKPPALLMATLWADDASWKMYPSKEDSAKRDAARHMLASAMLSDKMGRGATKAFGMFHEFSGAPLKTAGHWLGLSKPRGDYFTDTNNNEIGASMSGLAQDPARLQQAVRGAIEQGTGTRVEKGRVSLVPDDPDSMVYGGGAKQDLKAYKDGGEAKAVPGEQWRQIPVEDDLPRPAARAPSKGVVDRAKEIGQRVTSMAKGATELPYDIAGAPVDIATLLMRPFGYNTNAPVMGSDWIKEKATALGVRPEPPADPVQRSFYTAGEMLSGFANPASVARRVGPAAEKAVRAGATEVGKRLDQAVMEGTGPLSGVVSPAVRPVAAAPSGPKAAPTSIYTPTPSADSPFVGRIDKYAASLPGDMRKDQLLGMIRSKFRDYEIGRAEEALADLDAAAKVSPSELLNRLRLSSDPSTYKTQVINPQEGGFYPTFDNPYEGKPLGVIHLVQTELPEVAEKARKAAKQYEDLRLKTYSLSNQKDLDEFLNSVRKGAEEVSPNSSSRIEEALAPFAQAHKVNLELKALNTLATAPAATDGYFDRVNELVEQTPGLSFREASDQIKASTITDAVEQLAAYYDIPEARQLVPGLIKGDNLSRDALYALLRPARQAANQKSSEAGYDLRDVLDEVFLGGNKRYMGQHASLQNEPNPIAFSRFSEHEAMIPGLGRAKGIYVNELQSDRLDDIRKSGPLGGSAQKDFETLYKPLIDKQTALTQQLVELRMGRGSPTTDQGTVLEELRRVQKRLDKAMERMQGGTYSLKESFPGMETSPQVIQQLMAKNVVAAAVNRRDNFVAFPGKESKQSQLYEKLPNNLKQVVKDLGPGFEFRPIELIGPDGKPRSHDAIVWGPEGAARLSVLGVPFKKGGLVDKNTAFIKANT